MLHHATFKQIHLTRPLEFSTSPTPPQSTFKQHATSLRILGRLARPSACRSLGRSWARRSRCRGSAPEGGGAGASPGETDGASSSGTKSSIFLLVSRACGNEPDVYIHIYLHMQPHHKPWIYCRLGKASLDTMYIYIYILYIYIIEYMAKRRSSPLNVHLRLDIGLQIKVFLGPRTD